MREKWIRHETKRNSYQHVNQKKKYELHVSMNDELKLKGIIIFRKIFNLFLILENKILKERNWEFVESMENFIGIMNIIEYKFLCYYLFYIVGYMAGTK